MLIQDLLDAYGYYQTLIGFVNNNGLAEVLSTIGDTHLSAAKQELVNLTRTKDVRSCLNRAATNLLTALIAYEKQLPSSATMFALNPTVHVRTYDHWRITLVLLVTCYIYLGELNLAGKYINRELPLTQKSRSVTGTIDIGTSIAIWTLSPVSWLAQARREKYVHISEYDFLVFRSRAMQLVKS